jgi:hypothetical protein
MVARYHNLAIELQMSNDVSEFTGVVHVTRVESAYMRCVMRRSSQMMKTKETCRRGRFAIAWNMTRSVAQVL